MPAEDDLHAREDSETADQPLSGPGAIQKPVPDGTTGETPSTPGINSSGVMVATSGLRGPNGGVMAVCQSCSREWEREKRRGRPSLMCGECR